MSACYSRHAALWQHGAACRQRIALPGYHSSAACWRRKDIDAEHMAVMPPGSALLFADQCSAAQWLRKGFVAVQHEGA